MMDLEELDFEMELDYESEDGRSPIKGLPPHQQGVSGKHRGNGLGEDRRHGIDSVRPSPPWQAFICHLPLFCQRSRKYDNLPPYGPPEMTLSTIPPPA